MADRVYSIGSLARGVGVAPSRIRYYESIGLLPDAARSAGGQRLYLEADRKRLAFITRCREFGFTIGQVTELLSLSASRDTDCRKVGEVARVHLAEVRQRLARLAELETALGAFVDECDMVCGGGPSRDCVVFDSLRG